MATGNYDGAGAGAKHVPGAIAVLLASSNYCAADNGKRVRLVRTVPIGYGVNIISEGELLGTVFNDGKVSGTVWEVEAVDNHLHLTATCPICVTNNVYLQKYLLIIGDESLLKNDTTKEPASNYN